MTNDRPTDPAELLKLLEPAIRRGLERHLSAATEWFPHEYVPYEVGRNYKDEPWEETDSALGIVSRTALEVNLLTEDNLPYYHLALWEMFGRGGPWDEWVRRWTAEEGRHAIVLRDYLTVTRGADPVVARARPDGPGRAAATTRTATRLTRSTRSTASSTRRCRSWPRGSRTATRARSRGIR